MKAPTCSTLFMEVYVKPPKLHPKRKYFRSLKLQFLFREEALHEHANYRDLVSGDENEKTLLVANAGSREVETGRVELFGFNLGTFEEKPVGLHAQLKTVPEFLLTNDREPMSATEAGCRASHSHGVPW